MGKQETRSHIVEAADQLFYRQGYEHTSFADIADAVQISRGNFYYHFKTKDEILDAVIGVRLATTRQMLNQWESETDQPADRIVKFIGILTANQADIKRYGCPVGTLASELAKLNHTSKAEANALFTLFRTWLRKQFAALGREADADALAMHLIAWHQGVSTLMSSFRDDSFVRREVDQMCEWVKSCTEDGARHADRTRTARRTARKSQRSQH